MKKEDLNIENKMNELSGISRFRLIFGGIFFIIIATFVMIHLGFVEDDFGSKPIRKTFLTRQNLWLVNSGLGILGGIILGYKRFLIAAVSGLVASIAITGSALLYLSWRQEILSVEIVIPLLAGLVGIALYNNLAKLNAPE